MLWQGTIERLQLDIVLGLSNPDAASAVAPATMRLMTMLLDMSHFQDLLDERSTFHVDSHTAPMSASVAPGGRGVCAFWGCNRAAMNEFQAAASHAPTSVSSSRHDGGVSSRAISAAKGDDDDAGAGGDCFIVSNEKRYWCCSDACARSVEGALSFAAKQPSAIVRPDTLTIILQLFPKADLSALHGSRDGPMRVVERTIEKRKVAFKDPAVATSKPTEASKSMTEESTSQEAADEKLPAASSASNTVGALLATKVASRATPRATVSLFAKRQAAETTALGLRGQGSMLSHSTTLSPVAGTLELISTVLGPPVRDYLRAAIHVANVTPSKLPFAERIVTSYGGEDRRARASEGRVEETSVRIVSRRADETPDAADRRDQFGERLQRDVEKAALLLRLDSDFRQLQRRISDILQLADMSEPITSSSRESIILLLIILWNILACGDDALAPFFDSQAPEFWEVYEAYGLTDGLAGDQRPSDQLRILLFSCLED